MDKLANPAVLAVIFGAFGSAFMWLWAQITKANNQHRACEVKLAQMEERDAQRAREISAVQGTCATLTELLRKEINIG